MISRDEFPYLRQLVINDAYSVKNLTVPVFEGKEFKHLILTGKNGSGKTTVLYALKEAIRFNSTYDETLDRVVDRARGYINEIDRAQSSIVENKKWIEQNARVIPYFKNNDNVYFGFKKIIQELIVIYFVANRVLKVQNVSTVTREDSFIDQLQKKQFDSVSENSFKQYLVNKKVYQVFDAMEGKDEGSKQQARFFEQFEHTLAKIFDDPNLKLEFVRENFEFYINLSDGRRFTFNQLSAGFSAFLSILNELLMRTDLIRKQANDYTYDPCGFVLIDEPETHLHLEMQYQILPLLTNLFPNLQFIVATHSPAVASSITNATVFDLSSGKIAGDEAAGSSFSELMQTHFGVDNEYSNVADAILEEIDKIGALPDRREALRRLQQLFEEQGRYMSPVLKLDVQAQLQRLQREKAA